MGRVLNGLDGNPWAEANQRLHDIVIEWFNSAPGGTGFFTGNNFSIRRADWQAAGGMAGDWTVCGGEEREFAARWAALGGRVVRDDQALVFHFHALTAGKFLNQQFRYGRGAWFARGWRVDRGELQWRILTGSPNWSGRAILAASQVAVAAGWAFQGVLGRKQKDPRL
jgi:GT2 family glycosyltransferase